MGKATKKITVRTHPNGYELKVERRTYMTFSVKELVAAVFHHLLLDKEEYVDKDLSENLMIAAATWPTVGASIEGNAKIMAEIQEARRDARVARQQNSTIATKIDAQAAEYKELKGKYIIAKAKADQMDKALRRAEDAYNLYNREKRLAIKLQKELTVLKNMEDARKRAADRRERKKQETNKK
jgi:hypothetical protein